jgi:DNA-binding NarL/FixJ family response regulator
MPLMDGKVLIERIRMLDPNARIILLSGFVDHLGLTEQNTGADAVIAKSSHEPAHLVRSVKRLVNRGLRKPPASQANPPTRARGATP